MRVSLAISDRPLCVCLVRVSRRAVPSLRMEIRGNRSSSHTHRTRVGSIEGLFQGVWHASCVPIGYFARSDSATLLVTSRPAVTSTDTGERYDRIWLSKPLPPLRIPQGGIQRRIPSARVPALTRDPRGRYHGRTVQRRRRVLCQGVSRTPRFTPAGDTGH